MIKAREDLTAEGGYACKITKMGTMRHQHPFLTHLTKNFTGVVGSILWKACEEFQF